MGTKCALKNIGKLQVDADDWRRNEIKWRWQKVPVGKYYDLMPQMVSTCSYWITMGQTQAVQMAQIIQVRKQKQYGGMIDEGRFRMTIDQWKYKTRMFWTTSRQVFSFLSNITFVLCTVLKQFHVSIYVNICLCTAHIALLNNICI